MPGRTGFPRMSILDYSPCKPNGGLSDPFSEPVDGGGVEAEDAGEILIAERHCEGGEGAAGSDEVHHVVMGNLIGKRSHVNGQSVIDPYGVQHVERAGEESNIGYIRQSRCDQSRGGGPVGEMSWIGVHDDEFDP